MFLGGGGGAFEMPEYIHHPLFNLDLIFNHFCIIIIAFNNQKYQNKILKIQNYFFIKIDNIWQNKKRLIFWRIKKNIIFVDKEARGMF